MSPMHPNLIAIAGISRCGKDTFYQTLIKVKPGGIRISVGDIIREECAEFIKATTGIDPSNCTDKEKEIIRPILVGYGITKRKQTDGGYFVDKLQKKMDYISSQPSFNFAVNYFVITDIRFAEYDYDEPEWVKDINGVLVHIKRILKWVEDVKNETRTPIYLSAPNKTEEENDPKLCARADFRVEWETRNDEQMFRDTVDKFLNWYNV